MCPKKYRGDPTQIFFRSSWELTAMKFFDYNTNVIEWGSEEMCIPYLSPLDMKTHRYFPDFLIRVKTKSGAQKTYLIEVKPLKQTKEPEKRKKTRAYINEVMTYGVNLRKWESAKKYCEAKGWEFKIITEKELGMI